MFDFEAKEGGDQGKSSSQSCHHIQPSPLQSHPNPKGEQEWPAKFC